MDIMKPQSAYRQNMMNQLNKQAQAAPVNTGNLGRDLLGSIGNMARTNPAQANKLFSQYQTFTQDPTSPIYKPYQKATNPAFKALADLGFDASGLDREWFNNNTEWQNYLVYGDKTNTPKDPGKKGTIQQKIAYQLNQYAKGLDSTEAMDSEWAAMKDDINYWANRTDLNLSPDQIVEKVTKNMKTKYPTLYKMDNSTNPGETLLELNHGTDYSRDGMYGAIWAARNNGGTGSNLMDIVMGSMGEGNVWQKNDAIAAALDRNNPDTYAPYSIGMTLEDEGAYFGVPYFTDEKLEEIQRDLDYNNPADVEMYNSVFSAHKTTKEAQGQLDNLIKDVDRWIGLNYSEEKILKNLDNALDSPDYNILRQMDDSIDNGTKLVKTTQRIDYRKADMIQRIKDVVAIRDGKKDASDMMQEMGLEGYSDGQQQVNDVMSQHAAMIADSIWGGLSPVEQKYFQTSPKLNGKQVAEMVYKAKQGLLGPANQDIDMNWVADMATKQAASAEKDYIGVNLDTLTVRSQYEKVRQEADGIQQQLNDLDQKYSNIILASKEIPEKMTIVVDEDTGLSVTYTMDPDGKYRYHPSDNVAFEYNLPAQDYMRNNGLTPDELLEQLRHGDTLTRANNYADSIRSAKETAPSGDISPEEIAQADETMKSLQSKLDGYRSYMAEHQEEYDKATAKLNAADARRKRIGDITLRKSGFSVDPAQSDAVVNYVSFFSDWQKPTDTIYSVIDDLNYTYNSLNGTPYDEDAEKAVKANIADIDDQIESAQYVLQNYENIPQQYAKSIQANIDYLESRKRLYGDFLLSKEENFQDLVDEGKRMNMTGSNLEYGVNALQFNQLDKDEQDVYFALIASQGIDAAKQFLDDINGNLLTRQDETIDAATKELAKSGAAGRILNEAFSIASAAIEVPLSMAYMLESVFGKGDEWLRVPSKAAKAANQATIEELHNVYQGTVWDKVWPTLAEMVNNRGRSMVSSYAFGWMIPAGANDIFHAFPIATIAMTDAYAEAKEHNMEDWQAWTIAGVNFLAESVTEGIEFGHYNEVFKEGATLQSFTDYFLNKIAGLDWLSEATGETINNIIERAADRYIGGDRSEHERRVQAYIDAGICDNREDAEMMVAGDYVKEDIHTAIVSALSSFLDVGTFAAVKLKSNVDYAIEVQQYRKMGDAETTIADLKNRDRAILEGMQRADAQKRAGVAEEQQQTTAEETEQAPRVLPSVAPESVQNAQQDEYDTDLTILENARGADITALTSTLSAVLQINEQNSDQAAASAQALSDLFGEEYLDSVENVMYGGIVAGVDIGAIKMGLQYAALADGACKETVQSEEFQKASPDQQAQMLAEANVQDAQSAEVQTAVAGNVKEARIAAIEQQIMADSARGTMVEQAQKTLADKWLAELDAQKNLETQHGVVAAAAMGITRANEAIANGTVPTATAVDSLIHASKEYGHQLSVEQEYQQRLENAQREHKDAEANLEQAQQDTRAEIRAEAEQIVAKEDADRAAKQKEIEAEQQAAEQAAIEEQQRFQAEEDERTGVAQEARENSMIETVLDNENLEGEERDQRRDALSNQRDAVKESNVDLNGKVTNAEGFLAINAFSRKLGLTFDMADLPENVRGKYENGIVYLNQNRVKSGNMSVGQAMVEAALHEVTHFMENTGAYKTYRNTVLDSLFSGTGINSASNAMELYNNSPSFRAAIDNIINERTQAGDRLGGDDQETKIQNAEKELIADFARTKLAQKDTVQRFMDAGLGGRIRNGLHNINQAMKNYFSRMTGEERQQAEYLRRAERAYQKAMTQAAKSAVHPEASQFSIMQVAQAANLDFDADTMTLYDKNHNVIDGVKNKVTPEIMSQTPVGHLIRTGLDSSSQGKALDMMTGLMNMIARYKDSDLVWEIGASTLSSTFSAMKANSDTQYKSTVDFGTICAKTQAIVDVMSQVMLDKIDPETGMLKKGMKPGLTRQEIMKVYDATHNANLSVPCPVCYVFSRWMGVPSLLGQMSQFQKDHVIMKKDGKTIDWDATQAHVDEYVAKMYEKYGDKDGVNDKKTKLQNKMKSLEEKRNNLETMLLDKTISKEEKAKIKDQIETLLGNMTDVEDELGEVRAFNWVSQALCVNDGKFKVDRKNFRITPDSVLFDLNKTSEFANDTKNWRYRTTRGAGMGKAIMPYSGETIGDILKGVNNGKRQSNLKNPWLNYVEGGSNAAATRQLNDARTRARKQNLLGGQRLQSTSDFRPEWGLDYIMSFLELQAAGSKVQMYTKVAEAIDFFASVGADVNMSIMGKGTGWHEATAEELKQMTPEQREQATLNGKVYVLDFSDITGMPFYGDPKTGRKGAVDYKNQYDNVQMILVGMNDTHIRLAMKNSDIDFIIPWHSSGNSKEVLSSLISSVGEKLNTSVDYTTTQSDMIKGETKSYYDENGEKVEYKAPGKQTDAEKHIWDLRMRILTGKANKPTAKGGFTEAERTEVYNDPWLNQLYERFYVEGKDANCYHVVLTGDQAKQIFPYEYWDTSLTKDQADENGKRFVEYCDRMGIIPRFSQFKDDPGYWKLLIDRPMYNNDGTYHEQQTINVTNARIGSLDKNGKLDKSTSDLPTQAQAAYAPKDKRSPKYQEYTQRQTNAVNTAEQALGMNVTDEQSTAIEDAKAIDEAPYRTGANTQYSVYGEMTDADMSLMLSESNEDFASAVSQNDNDAAQDDISFALETPVSDFSETDSMPIQLRDDGMIAVHNLSVERLMKALHVGGFAMPSIAVIPSGRSWTKFSDVSIFFGRNTVDNNANHANLLYSGDAYTPMFSRNSTEFDNMDDAVASLQSQEEREFVGDFDASRYIRDFRRINDIEAGRALLYSYENMSEDERNAAWSTLESMLQSISDRFHEKVTKKLFMTEKKFDTLDYKHSFDVELFRLFEDYEAQIDLGEYNDEAFADDIAGLLKYGFGIKKDPQLVSEIMDYIKHAHNTENSEFLEAKPWRPVGVDEVASILMPSNVDPSIVQQLLDAGLTEDKIRYYSTPEERQAMFSDIPKTTAGVQFSTGGEQTAADQELNQTLMDSGVLSQDEVDNYNYQTSRPLEGQNPWMSTAQGPKQRQFGTGMLQDSDEIARAAKAYALEQNSYFPDTNEEQIDRAINWIRSNKRTPNSDGFYESYQKVIDPKFDYRSADGQARMVAVMGMAVAKNDIMAQVSLTDAFNRQGTDLGRALQARKLFRLMTPEGRISTLQKMLSDTQDDINSKGTNIDLKFSEWIYRAAAAATEEGDFERVYQAAATELAQQVPANWKDKLRGWRMLSMLGNPRTHIRNVIGNALFVPAVSIKNKLGAVGEIVTRQKERTKTLAPILSSEIREFARQDAQSIKDILTGESKYNEGNPVKREQKPFKGLLQAVIDFNGNLLESEDWIFLKGHYRRALGGWMQANRYDASDMLTHPELLEKGRAYAIQEAQKATYRDFNKLASTLNNVSRQGGVAGFLVDATLPFKKTPANILRRGIEYSPAGIMRSVISDLYHLKQWNDFQKGKLNALPDKAISPTEFIDHLCSGLTGTAIMAVGALLSSAGVVACGLDDDDDKFEKEKGNQKYSFKVNIAGQDFTYTVDWAAPMSMPFFVGSAIYDQFSKEGDVDINALMDAFGNITEPVFNLSMLDGINTLFKTSQYDDTNTLTQIGGKIVSNYVTSYVPSLLGAIARTVDDTQRKNFVKSGDGTGLTGTFNYAREQVENKLPGVSQSNIPVRDIWGNEKTSSLAERIAENFISPGYIENYKNDPIINEMARLFEITGESKLIPSDPPKSFSYKNHTYKLEAEQWDAYKETRGKTAFTMLNELLGSSDYREADSATQANMIKEVWDYAEKVGKKAAVPEYDFDQMTVETISTDAKISGYKDEMMKALASEDYDAFDTMIEALHEQGVEDKDIKAKISGKYRDLYKEAYRKNDERTMGEIEDLLVYGTSLYSKKDIAGWEKDVDEKYGDK